MAGSYQFATEMTIEDFSSVPYSHGSQSIRYAARQLVDLGYSSSSSAISLLLHLALYGKLVAWTERLGHTARLLHFVTELCCIIVMDYLPLLLLHVAMCYSSKLLFTAANRR